MKKRFKKLFATICVFTLVISSFGIDGTFNSVVKGDDESLAELSSWKFFQLGDASSSWGDVDNIRYNSVTFSDGTVLDEFAKAKATKDETTEKISVQGGITDSGKVSDSLLLNIESNGYQADHRNHLNTPWAISAYMDGIKLEEGHDYKISFKAKATKKKYANFSIKNAYSASGVAETLTIMAEEKEFSFDYGCYFPNTTTTFELLLGAFPYKNDEIRTYETEWKGKITISEIKFVDLGLNPDYDFDPDPGHGVLPKNNQIKSNWTNIADPYEDSDQLLGDTTFESDATNIAANISITGWQAHWCDEEVAPDDAIIVGKSGTSNGYWGDKPYQIRSENTVQIEGGNTYTLKFTVKNEMRAQNSQKLTEKNITVAVLSGIKNDYNAMLNETITVPAGATQTYSFDVPISIFYIRDTVKIQLAYGSFFYSYTLTKDVKSGKISEEDAQACKYAYAYPTTENTNAHGMLTFSDIAFYNPVEKIKNEKDVEALTNLIQQLRDKGMYKISSNIKSTQYVWSDELDSRLIGIKWGGLDLKGAISFEGLDELQQLIICDNQLTQIDVSKNPKLKYLDCSGNNLNTLDVGDNSELTILKCGSNNLSQLDLTKNQKIVGVWCDKTVNVTGCDEPKINPDEEETTTQAVPSTNAEPSSEEITTSGEVTTAQAEVTTENATQDIAKNLKAPKLKKIKAKKKALKIRWKKVANVNGYQIKYSTNRKMKRAKKITIKKAKKTSKLIKKLKSKKKYFVRIRSFILDNGKRKYSKWSKRRSKKTK